MKKLKTYKKNQSQKSKLSEILDVVKNADQRACSLLTLLSAAFSTAILNHHLKKLVSIVKVTFQLVLTIFPYFNQSSHLNTSTIYSI